MSQACASGFFMKRSPTSHGVRWWFQWGIVTKKYQLVGLKSAGYSFQFVQDSNDSKILKWKTWQEDCTAISSFQLVGLPPKWPLAQPMRVSYAGIRFQGTNPYPTKRVPRKSWTQKWCLMAYVSSQEGMLFKVASIIKHSQNLCKFPSMNEMIRWS